MPNITVKGISEETLSLLRKKAASNQRSMNKEIIEVLIKHADTKVIDVKAILKSIDKAKPLFKGKLTASQIQNTIRKGRK
jgi:chromosomal replication initiation ATPase DnaA